MNEQHPDLIKAFTAVLVEFDAILAKVPEGGLDWSEKEGE